jgi:hypothetical protein
VQFPDKKRSEVLTLLVECGGHFMLDLSFQSEENLELWSVLEDLVFEGLLEGTPDENNAKMVHYRIVTS